MILIVGRCASGKDTVARLLSEKGLAQLKSYTDRPPRPGEVDTHVFVSTDELPTKNIIAKTKIGDYTYLATREQYDDCDLYVIDPKGIADLSPTLPKSSVDIVFVRSDPETRRRRWLERDSTDEALDKFMAREMAEMGQFATFELSLMSATKPFPCVRNIYVYENTGNLEDLEKAVDEIYEEIIRA